MAIDVYVSFRDGRSAKIAGVSAITLVDKDMYDGEYTRDIFDMSALIAANTVDIATGKVSGQSGLASPQAMTKAILLTDITQMPVGGDLVTTDDSIVTPVSDDWSHHTIRPAQKMFTIVQFTLTANNPTGDGIFFFANLIVGISTDAPNG